MLREQETKFLPGEVMSGDPYRLEKRDPNVSHSNFIVSSSPLGQLLQTVEAAHT